MRITDCSVRESVVPTSRAARDAPVGDNYWLQLRQKCVSSYSESVILHNTSLANPILRFKGGASSGNVHNCQNCPFCAVVSCRVLERARMPSVLQAVYILHILYKTHVEQCWAWSVQQWIKMNFQQEENALLFCHSCDTACVSLICLLGYESKRIARTPVYNYVRWIDG